MCLCSRLFMPLLRPLNVRAQGMARSREGVAGAEVLSASAVRASKRPGTPPTVPAATWGERRDAVGSLESAGHGLVSAGQESLWG